MSDPYRVIVWAPGNLGSSCIQEILRLPNNFKLVGVLGFSEHKHGKDIGTLLGLPPLGVKVTTNKEEIFALPADCVLHTAAPPVLETGTMDRDMIRLLESGKNVVSAVSYFYPPFQGQAHVDKLEAACRKGGVSLHGTGENAGFMLERLATTVSALATTVESVKLTEAVNVGRAGLQAISYFGFMKPPEEAVNGPIRDLFQHWMFPETVSFTCMALFGRPPEKVVYTPIYLPSAEEVIAGELTIPKGGTRFVRHVFEAFLDGRPRVTCQMEWYILEEDAPFKDGAPDQWKIDIDAKPCPIHLTLEVGQPKGGEGEHRVLSYDITASILLQAVPVVCAAPPGIVYASTFTNCVEDFHRLSTRKTLVT